MSKDRYYVLTLPSVHFVLKVEQEALVQSVPVELIPTPRTISSDCGMAVKFHEESLEWLLRLMAQTAMPAGRLYRRMEDDFEFLGPTGESGNGH
jgi:hypothetical protein